MFRVRSSQVSCISIFHYFKQYFKSYLVHLCNTKTLPKNLMYTYTVYCFLFVVKKFRGFHGLLRDRESFWRKFSLLCSNLAIIGRIFYNREYFSGNEGKDLQPRNFFTANKKQYTVCISVRRQLLDTFQLIIVTQREHILLTSNFHHSIAHSFGYLETKIQVCDVTRIPVSP